MSNRAFEKRVQRVRSPARPMVGRTSIGTGTSTAGCSYWRDVVRQLSFALHFHHSTTTASNPWHLRSWYIFLDLRSGLPHVCLTGGNISRPAEAGVSTLE